MTDISTAQQRRIDRVGGPGAVRAVVDEFYDNVLNDPRVAGRFEGIDVKTLRGHQATLIVTLLSDAAPPFDLKAAHEGMHITPREYDVIVGHLVGALRKFDVPADIIEYLGGVVEQVRPLIVNDGADAAAA